jgi:uncharacterized repeat protein (TIGR03803 family)
MKTRIKNLFVLPFLVIALDLHLSCLVTAQTFTTLHNFNGGTDGAYPVGGLVLSGNTLYGTTEAGSNGTVFAVQTDGTDFRILHNFTGGTIDGANPRVGLILSGDTLYGVTSAGGASGNGTVFKLNIDGTGFTTLHWFTALTGNPSANSDGALPQAALVLSSNTLYGTAPVGGTANSGTVFKVNTDGTGFQTLHSFSTYVIFLTNSDGAVPYGQLVISGNTLYGATTIGGNWGNGTVFKVNTDGSGFTNLHSFSSPMGNTNSDGASPWGGLVLMGNALYGTTTIGGSADNGTVFKVNTDGTGFTNLHNFTGGSGGVEWYQSSRSGLVISGNALYGTTVNLGAFGNGTVFVINTDGSGFTNLYSFTSLSGNINSDGANPTAGLILSGNILFGTATYGGGSGYGTVFSLSLTLPSAPRLTMTPSGTNVILTWPTNATSFSLESTTNLDSLAIWTTVLPAPVIANGQCILTNPISGSQMFFRLQAN